jgi:hypothetical protein
VKGWIFPPQETPVAPIYVVNNNFISVSSGSILNGYDDYWALSGQDTTDVILISAYPEFTNYFINGNPYHTLRLNRVCDNTFTFYGKRFGFNNTWYLSSSHHMEDLAFTEIDTAKFPTISAYKLPDEWVTNVNDNITSIHFPTECPPLSGGFKFITANDAGWCISTGSTGILNLDSDASAYITAVASTGVAITYTQQEALNTFFVSAKADGYYSNIKRLFLPIWGVASANAIDMITLGSGTFNGSVTHTSGYVVGDGRTGYFDTGISPLSAGINTSTGSMFVLHNNFPIGYRHGCDSGTSLFSMVNGPASSIRITIIGNPGVSISNYYVGNGSNAVTIASRTSPTALSGMKRGSSGVSPTSVQTVDMSYFAVPDYNIYALASNVGGVPTIHSSTSTPQLGVFGFGLSLTEREMEYLTLRIKNLWETSTGLTLP